jgi:hypothetical protein
VFRITDGIVDLEEQDTPLARQLDGASADEVRAALTQAVPDPVAVRYASLPPRVRLATVLASRTAGR